MLLKGRGSARASGSSRPGQTRVKFWSIVVVAYGISAVSRSATCVAPGNLAALKPAMARAKNPERRKGDYAFICVVKVQHIG